MDYLVIGAGLTGCVIARFLAEQGKQVTIVERRDHFGGNLFDYVDEHGFLVQKYGPHAFHTNDKYLYDYICRFESWKPYYLRCGAVLDGKYTPTPFNFTTIETFYGRNDAERLKKKLTDAYPGRETVAVTQVLKHPDSDIRAYAEFLFHKDYAPYTAKQWKVSPEEIDLSVLKRVPLRLSYRDGYFDDVYQVLPEHSYCTFFQNLLSHSGIELRLQTDALTHLAVSDGKLLWNGEVLTVPTIYTGALDELFGFAYGPLPYRSLEFQWKYDLVDRFQQAPVVAYPQEEGYTRITEYKQLPVQNRPGTSYAVEYPVTYRPNQGMEPYYPVLTEKSQKQFAQYAMLAQNIPNLVCCGRLADFKYYNMDQALARALDVCKSLQL